MNLHLKAWKAVEEYRAYVDKICASMRLDEKEAKKKLSLESFAIWLENEWPRFVEARKK